MRNTLLVPGLCVSIVMLLPSHSTAQACVCAPGGEGSFSVAPAYQYQHYDFGGNLNGYGLDATLNLPGRWGLEGGYAYWDASGLDLRENRLRARPSLEVVRHGGGSVCLVAGAEYGWFKPITVQLDPQGVATTSSHEWILPAGLGFGFRGGRASGSTFTVYTIPQALFVRGEGRTQIPAQGLDVSAAYHTNELGVETGARLRHGPLFGGVSWLHTTWSALPNVWTLTVGYVHGR